MGFVMCKKIDISVNPRVDEMNETWQDMSKVWFDDESELELKGSSRITFDGCYMVNTWREHGRMMLWTDQ